jgi:sugar phosphate isomerase/epimerase
MNLAVSNFAWDFDNLEEVSEILKENGINQVELIFTKYKNWDELTESEVYKLKELLNKHELSALSSQSLFYGVDCKSIVTDSKKFINHFNKLISYSKIIGIQVLVLGSPGLRNIENITNVFDINLHETFKTIDNMLEGTGITLCIEPNASSYGGQFFTTIEEIVRFLTTYKFKNIFTMCDTHNSWLENKDPNEEIEKYFQYIKHIHISEIQLKNITDYQKFLEIKNKLSEKKYSGIITYEVLKNKNVIDSIVEFNYYFNKNEI